MSDIASAILLGFTVLAVKHTIADFFLQTPFQYLNKGTYGHVGGIIHSGIHMGLTPAVFLVLPAASVLMAVLILAGEFVIHYHVDWAKEQAVKRHGWTVDDAWYWRVLGLDQFAHTLTYIVIVAILIG